MSSNEIRLLSLFSPHLSSHYHLLPNNILIPTDPSHLPKYIQFTKDDPYQSKRSLFFCASSFRLPLLLLNANPPIEVDSDIIRELILLVKEALPTILTNISNMDYLIASHPSDSSSTTPLVSGVDTQTIDSLKQLRNDCEDFLNKGWSFFVNVTKKMTDPHKSSFQTIILDDPSFPDLILNSLKLLRPEIRRRIILAIANIIINYPTMREQFMTANLVGRMFERDDFVSLPLSESNTLFHLTRFIDWMFPPIGENEDARFEQYRLIHVSVFKPAKQFLTFMFHNSHKLVLDEEAQTELNNDLCWIHRHIKNIELRSDELDADFVSELVKWEVQKMVEMENEDCFDVFFDAICDRTVEWKEDKPERQKRREVSLKEEGWDDAFELRVVGIEADVNEEMVDLAADFRIEQALNADELE
ncbi:hypothetical protein BLNAU_14514 [Blattamonas nauphoetae]|uniref:Uncharacterized protein n=1 Tax=Blattamonas nauphoetae TaxID=2049346 RepID=A0ABQ9XEX8_9EUKA|nr:hypothetical protein BLNAU_14514 [Blattamonas nauphoetae]